jgi:hypothetical protein
MLASKGQKLIIIVVELKTVIDLPLRKASLLCYEKEK